MGVVLAAAAIILISFGFNNLNRWGLGLARPNAPFDLLGLSPAPIMIVVGIVLGQAFLMWTHRRQAAGKTPLLALEVIDSPQERAAVYAMFAVVALEAMLNFSVPLYIQIVQGRSPLATAIAMMPFNLTVFFTAMLIVRLYDRLTPRQIGRYGFMLCTVGARCGSPLSCATIGARSRFSFGLVLFGIGQGSLVTLLFNVLVTASPKELAGDVGSLRGTDAKPRRRGRHGGRRRASGRPAERDRARQLAANPKLPPEIQSQVDLDNINFVSNDRLRASWRHHRHAEQVEEAVRVNTEARLRALKIGLLIMAGLALLAILPAGRLPDYLPGEIPSDPPTGNRLRAN